MGILKGRKEVWPLALSRSSERSSWSMPEASDNRAYIERCQREAERCRLAGSAPGLTDTQRLGAIQGEMDWLVAQQIAEEEAGLGGAG